jgi:hypothetical protein
MKNLKSMEVWFITGSQHLYSKETTKQVNADSRMIAECLNRGVVTTSDNYTISANNTFNVSQETCQSQTEEGSGGGGDDSGDGEEQGDDDSDPNQPQAIAGAIEILEQFFSLYLLLATESVVLLSYILLHILIVIYLPKLSGPVICALTSILGLQLGFIYRVSLRLRAQRIIHRRLKKSRIN